MVKIKRLILWAYEYRGLCGIALVVGGVESVEIAVTRFEEFEDAAFVDYTGTTVVGQFSEKNVDGPYYNTERIIYGRIPAS